MGGIGKGLEMSGQNGERGMVMMMIWHIGRHHIELDGSPALSAASFHSDQC